MRSIYLFCLVTGFLVSTPVKAELEVPSRLTRDEARALLLKYSPALKAAIARTDAERADLVRASRRPNPELFLSSEGLNLDPDSRSFVDEQELSISLRYRLETSGKREKRTRIEGLGAEISEMEVAEVTRHLLFQLDQKYFLLVLAQENLELAHSMLEDFEEILRLNRIRYENGEISGGELRRAEVEQYRFLEDIVTAEVALENAQDQLLSLLGSDRFDDTVTAVDPLKGTITEVPPIEMRETALATRSDLKIARTSVLEASAGIELEKAHSKPDLIPFVGFRRDFGTNGLIAGIQLPLPLFDRNEGGIERSIAHRRERGWDLKEREIEVLTEVQVAVNELRGNLRRVELLETEYIDKSNQARDIAESAYRLGGISLIEFLDAQRTYREMTQLMNTALYDLRVSQARLELVVGREP